MSNFTSRSCQTLSGSSSIMFKSISRKYLALIHAHVLISKIICASTAGVVRGNVLYHTRAKAAMKVGQCNFSHSKLFPNTNGLSSQCCSAPVQKPREIIISQQNRILGGSIFNYFSQQVHRPSCTLQGTSKYKN